MILEKKVNIKLGQMDRLLMMEMGKRWRLLIKFFVFPLFVFIQQECNAQVKVSINKVIGKAFISIMILQMEVILYLIFLP